MGVRVSIGMVMVLMMMMISARMVRQACAVYLLRESSQRVG